MSLYDAVYEGASIDIIILPHPSICLYSLSLKLRLKAVFLVTLQRRRLRSNKNQHVKLNLLSEFELLLNQVSSSISVCQHE